MSLSCHGNFSLFIDAQTMATDVQTMATDVQTMATDVRTTEADVRTTDAHGYVLSIHALWASHLRQRYINSSY